MDINEFECPFGVECANVCISLSMRSVSDEINCIIIINIIIIITIVTDIFKLTAIGQ